MVRGCSLLSLERICAHLFGRDARREEEYIFRAAIAQAVLDAMGKVHGVNVEQRAPIACSAREWLRNGGTDFDAVCHMAGLEPAFVRRRLDPFIKSLELTPHDNVLYNQQKGESYDENI